ncbi:hypothetical protein FJY93_00560 [Candidatus Kaiserbacteria bacterium]|nr:hypothetical protein [Candidatus Kaiserbacteria bacterium]
MKKQGDGFDRIEKKIDALIEFSVFVKKKLTAHDKRFDSHDNQFEKVVEIIERDFGAVAEDISGLATIEHAIVIGSQVAGIERELRDIKRDLVCMADSTHKHDKDLAEAFRRIAKLEKRLDAFAGK